MDTPPKKILLAITKSNFGGAQRYVFDLARSLQKEGFSPAVLCGGEGTLVTKLKAETIPVILLPDLERDITITGDTRSFFFMCSLLKNMRPDVFHINSSKMGLGALAGRLIGIEKIVFTLHGFPWKEDRPEWQKIIFKFIIWLTILLSHTTICVTKESLVVTRRWPFIQNKLVVIHNGIEKYNLIDRNTARSKLLENLPNDTLIVGVASELHHIKGLDVLLRAWAKFTTDHEAELVILGSGEEKESLTQLSKSLSLTSVHFKGYIDNARTLFKAFDIFVLPSRSEAMPYSLIEAGYAGIPSLSSNVGGVSEVIEDKVSGLLVPPEGEGQLVSALTYLADHKGERERFGFALNKKIIQEFTLDKMVRDTIRVYAIIQAE